MRQRLAIARALIHDPPVLFLDEPTANLDPEGARTVRDFLLELRRERRTILLSTHLLDEADRICDRVGVLHTRLLAAGPPSELRAGRPGHVTRVQLAELTDAVVTAARAVAAGPVEVTSSATSSATGGPAGGTVAVPVGDPGRDNPALVAAIVAAGGRIRFVTEATTSLEEAYLTLLGGAGSTEPRVTQLEGTQLEGTQLEGTKPGGPQ
jgi:ABC-2 type transport system ATP-binding protein